MNVIMAGQMELRDSLVQLIEYTDDALVDEVGRVFWQGIVAVAGNFKSGRTDFDLDGVPDVEGHAQAVEAWTHISCCGGISYFYARLHGKLWRV